MTGRDHVALQGGTVNYQNSKVCYFSFSNWKFLVLC